jgi:hypothetical protein
VTALAKLLRFLQRLDAARMHYSLGHFRDSITVLITASGKQRWEAEAGPSIARRLQRTTNAEKTHFISARRGRR